MDQDSVQEILDELLGSLEPLEAQSSAVVQFLKAKGLANDEEFAPFLEQAANAANVRWRAVRVRTAALIAHAMKPDGESGEEKKIAQVESQAESKTGQKEASQAKQQEAQPDQPQETKGESYRPRADSRARTGSSPKKKDDSNDDARPSSDSDDNSESELSNPPLFTLGKSENEKTQKSGSGTSTEKTLTEKPPKDANPKSEATRA
jgi:hypothetical protein